MISWVVRSMCVKYARFLLAVLALGLLPYAAAAQGSGAPPAAPASPNGTSPPDSPPPPPPPPPPAQDFLHDWVFSGDFRVRYEDTTKQKVGAVPGILDPRHRMVIRFRSGLTKKITNQVDFGVRLSSGARGDPNTTDITLGDFGDKIEVSLDRVYLGWTAHNLAVSAGRIINPLVRTELVWDDDINFPGFAATYTVPKTKKVVPKITGMYSIVDEQSTSPDSYMVGGQGQVRFQPGKVWNLTVSTGYYDYTIKSLTRADSGDTLSNHLNETRTAYISDFNLLNATAIADYRVLGDRWPLRVSFDFVRNLGTRGVAEGEDEGKWLEMAIGRATARKDTRYRYGFARLETDAVLAAFTNDNTTFATNYLQHTFIAEYVASPVVSFNATWYVFRRDQVDVGPGTGPAFDKKYVSRLRLNVLAGW
jgi:Putative porin